jgi:pyruvate-formate lyase-activating enzyme
LANGNVTSVMAYKNSIGWLRRPLLHCAGRVRDSYIRTRIARQFRSGREHGFLPRGLEIETINCCNARCAMCPYPTITRPKGVMSTDVCKLIVDKVADWKAPLANIVHAGVGEPLLDKTLGEKIRYEKSVFPRAVITVISNGSLCDEKACLTLLSSGVDRLSISLNAMRKETYEKVMHLPYERTQENLKTLLRVRESSPQLRLAVSLIPTEMHTEEEIRDFRRYWEERSVEVFIPPWISWGGFFNHGIRQTQWPCRYIWNKLHVNWNGNVQMCCEDYDNVYSPGSLITQSPQEVFNSARMKQQRQDQVQGRFAWPECCLNCIETHDVAREFWKTGHLVPVKK